ncbi:MAG TPA: hypothetical protein VGB90_00740, partial [Alphaproteobacteria bacterium]
LQFQHETVIAFGARRASCKIFRHSVPEFAEIVVKNSDSRPTLAMIGRTGHCAARARMGMRPDGGS